jgi:hypothetical protein
MDILNFHHRATEVTEKSFLKIFCLKTLRAYDWQISLFLSLLPFLQVPVPGNQTTKTKLIVKFRGELIFVYPAFPSGIGEK